MTLKKIGEICTTMFIGMTKNQILESNFISTDVYIQKDKLFIGDEILEVTVQMGNKKFFLVTITNNFHLLVSYDYRQAFLLNSEEKTLRRIEKPTYITSNGFITYKRPDKVFYTSKDDHVLFGRLENSLHVYRYYLSNYEVVKKSFVIENIKFYSINRHSIYNCIKKERTYLTKIEVFSFEDCIYKDFQKRVSALLYVQKFLYIESLKFKKTSQIIVNFKDCQKDINLKLLKRLDSPFVDEQLKTGQEIYLDVEYSEFEAETFEFLEYIKSRIPTFFFEFYRKKYLYDIVTRHLIF